MEKKEDQANILYILTSLMEKN